MNADDTQPYWHAPPDPPRAPKRRGPIAAAAAVGVLLVLLLAGPARAAGPGHAPPEPREGQHPVRSQEEPDLRTALSRHYT